MSEASVSSSIITAVVTGGGVQATVSQQASSSSVASGSGQVSVQVSPASPAIAAVGTRLSACGDVAFNSLADGDVLQYSGSRWTNTPQEVICDGGNY